MTSRNKECKTHLTNSVSQRLFDQLCTLLRHHHRRSLQMRRRYLWEDAAISHPEPLDAMNPQLVVNHPRNGSSSGAIRHDDE